MLAALFVVVTVVPSPLVGATPWQSFRAPLLRSGAPLERRTLVVPRAQSTTSLVRHPSLTSVASQAVPRIPPLVAQASTLEATPGMVDLSHQAAPVYHKDLMENPTDALTNRDTKALAQAYEQCEDVTKAFSKTFYIGTAFMRPEARKHAWAIYAWCRRTDDIVDSPQALANPNKLDSDLGEWVHRLDDIWDQRPTDQYDLAMADTVRTYPTLSIQPFRDMVDGMIMDVPGHAKGKSRYETFDELYMYCYRVAATVGIMMLPILGTAPGVTEEEAKEPAIALGIALQLTNILRDVGEDLKRGRIYLPQDELKKFGLTEEDLLAGEVTEKYKEFMKFQIARARHYYAQAARGIPMLAPDARFAVRASQDLYARILDKIEENGYDNFKKRAYTTGLEKLGILPGSWMKSRQTDPSLLNPASLASYNAQWGAGSMVFAVVGTAVGVSLAIAAALPRRRPLGCSAEPLLG